MAIVRTVNLSKVYIKNVLDVEYGRLKLTLKNRKVPALNSLNLEIEEGETFGLLGPNGAGKTTTLKILMGLIFASSGEAFIMNKPLGDKNVKAQIGFLPENPYFYDYLKGWEFLDYYGQLYGIGRSLRRKKIPELLELVGLSNAANLPLKGYSKGMLQRIGVAQALINDPKIVFLDEPQSGLDPFGRKEIRDIIMALKEQKKTVFFSSHILADAEMICDRVAILSGGKMINIGGLSELLSAKINEYEILAQNISKEKLDAYQKSAKKVISQKDAVLIVVDKQELAEQIVKDLLNGAGKLISLTPRKETLEQFFIRQTLDAGHRGGKVK